MKGNMETPAKKRYFVLVLWLFLGWFGAHRFYMKKYTSALIMMILGSISLLYYKNELIYIFARMTWIILAGADFVTAVSGFFIYLSFILFATGLLFIAVWWLIDLIFVIKYVKKPDQ